MLICYSFFLIFSVQAQTKDETEKWIISKFDKWKKSKSSTQLPNPYSRVPISIKFNGCDLEIKSKYSTPESTEIQLYTIKIGDITSFTWDQNDFYIMSRKRNVIVKSYPIDDPSNAKMNYLGGCVISFETDAEENLTTRLTKAFENLKSFCPPTKDEKEAF